MQRIVVDTVEIPEGVVAAEMQFHPAPTAEQAWHQAATALVVRALLLREAECLGIAAHADETQSAEEATIQALLAREVAVPEADAATIDCYWQANRARFHAPDVYEAAHILFPAAAEDEPARAQARDAAEQTLALLATAPDRFAALARERSACSSRMQGGLLGQQSRGDLVPEIETFIFNLVEGQICPVPVASRYGYHVLRLDRLVRGGDLPFDSVSERIGRQLAAQSWQRGVSQYLRILAGRVRIEGIAFEGATSPLVR